MTASTWACGTPKRRSYSACERTSPRATASSASRCERIGSCSETSTVLDAAGRPLRRGLAADGAVTHAGTAEASLTSATAGSPAGPGDAAGSAADVATGAATRDAAATTALGDDLDSCPLQGVDRGFRAAVPGCLPPVDQGRRRWLVLRSFPATAPAVQTEPADTLAASATEGRPWTGRTARPGSPGSSSPPAPGPASGCPRRCCASATSCCSTGRCGRCGMRGAHRSWSSWAPGAEDAVAAVDGTGIEVGHEPRLGHGHGLVPAGRAAAASDGRADAAVVSLVDQPGMTAATVERLVAAWRADGRAAVATYGGAPRNPVLLPAATWARGRCERRRGPRRPGLAAGAPRPGQRGRLRRRRVGRRHRHPGRPAPAITG